MSAAPKRILIVEDDAAIRELEERILRASDFDVVSFDSPGAALTHAQGEHFDLYLLDVMMPIMNGFELARELRRNERTRRTPILFVTARGEADAKSEGFSAGAALYLVKPFTTMTLLAMVRGAIATAPPMPQA
jgi:DNA-binding response OmpR family regulator